MDVNWLGALSAGAMAMVISFLLALSGLPEVPADQTAEEEHVQYVPPDWDSDQ